MDLQKSVGTLSTLYDHVEKILKGLLPVECLNV